MGFQRVRRCKAVTFDNFCAISLATALEHHSANQFLKAATNLNFVQPKLFQASRQDDLRFSYCRVSVIQILDNADAAFRILCAYVDRSIRDHHVRRQAAPPQRTNARSDFVFLTILPPITALAVGLPAQRAIAQRFRAMAQMRSATRIEECLSLEAKRKTSARIEYFAFWTRRRHRRSIMWAAAERWRLSH